MFTVVPFVSKVKDRIWLLDKLKLFIKATNAELTCSLPTLTPENNSPMVYMKNNGQKKSDTYHNRERTFSSCETSPNKNS